ncbi:DUF2189 domain-containing protein [Phenylobacterium sp. LH3H17]|uniref:DUF2189 domain-containing protein n=1 Tax=Phenylobacterium sp. LH3H17 TaxID=2903901 RepID=UPI0020CA0059|nr:DUF2189 domain-containing protein [Phenylobacterium sp. LH3H17]UTP40836.1 DUF2189 domain-containing protein [Phenylobacterium sp. LH3H17]
MDATLGLPAIRTVALTEPFGWLADGWRDLMKAPGPLLFYGLCIAIASLALCYGVYVTNGAFWVMALTAGFVIIAPVLAMGPYEAGRRLDQGERPRLGQILFVRSAFRQDVAYLSLLLVLIYFFWGRVAQIVYGLSTYQIHRDVDSLIAFAIGSSDGRSMLLAGTVTGGILAFAAYSLVVVSAPMLLNPNSNVFAAVATSVRAVNANFFPLLLWAVIITALLLLSAATGFLALVVIFPWLGLASWRAYRSLTDDF